MGQSQWEVKARQRKVDELVRCARARKVTASEVATEDSTRRMLEREMVRHLPTARTPSYETWAQVVATLNAIEASESLPLVKECGCKTGECCVSCCLFPRCSECGEPAVAS